VRCWRLWGTHDAGRGLQCVRRNLLHVFVESSELHLVCCPYFVADGFDDEVELRLVHSGGGGGGGVRTADSKWCAQKDHCGRCIVEAGHLCAEDR
jgi:hypothetical protein